MSQPSITFAHLPPCTALDIVAEETTDELECLVHDAITRRAYQLFEENGRIAGRHEENWRQAESEVLRNSLEARDTGAWLSISGELPDSANDICIRISPRQILGHSKSPAMSIFLVARLAADVEPRTAIASLRNGQLKLMVKKRLENSHSK